MELISVIVPVYNVEPYLDRCIQSVLTQTYPNLEILLVDDGSTDQSGRICDKWASRDDRIRVIHKSNGGPAEARNTGLAAAKGAYLSFVDSDDWIHPQFMEVLYSALISNQADLAECDYVKSYQLPEVEAVHPTQSLFDTQSALRLHIQGQSFCQIVCNKLYRRDVIRHLFPQGKYHEDEFWTYLVLAACEKLVHVHAPMYYYFQRSGSIMQTTYSLRNLHAVEARVLRLEFIQAAYPELKAICEANLFFSCLYHGQKALSCLSSGDQYREIGYLSDTLSQYPLSNPGLLPLKHRLWYQLAVWSFPAVCRIRNFLRIGQ